MALRDWSTIASDNNSAPPIGAAEGISPGSVNNIMREMMASTRVAFEQLPWFDYGHTPVRVDNDTFTVATDLTATYYAGRRLKLVGATTGYCTIASSSYSAPDTTVNVTMDSGNVPTSLATVSLSIGADGSTLLSTLVKYDITDAETAAGVTPTNYYINSSRCFYSTERVGTVQDGTDQTSLVNDAITAVAGAQTLGTDGGLVVVPMGVNVTWTGLSVKKNVNVIANNGEDLTFFLAGYNAGGAVSEFRVMSGFHPAYVLDAHTDITVPTLGAGQVQSYRASMIWRYDGTSNWQLAQDINATNNKGLTLYALNSSRQTVFWDHSGSMRLGRRTGAEDYSTPPTTVEICNTASVVADDTGTATIFLKLLNGASSSSATVTHQKPIQLLSTGVLGIANDANSAFILTLDDNGRLTIKQGVNGGSFTTAQRNAFTVASSDIGLTVYDKTLNKPIWLKSNSPMTWVDATGATV